MSLGGGKGSSTSSTTTTSTDKRMVVGEYGIGVSSDSSTVNVTALDGSAIKSAFEFAATNDLTTAENVERLLGFAGDVFAGALTVLDKNAALVQSSGELVATAYEDAKGQTTDNKYLIAGALAIVGVVAVKALK